MSTSPSTPRYDRRDAAALRSASFKNDATFRRVPGLADASGVSFQAVNYPERYLRNVNGLLKLEATTSAAAQREATFRLVD